ncbi:hypothetical protein KC367_g702 [Hortaea werneckii]|nr:hypothetical protein KC342_g4825 [Hortaea werneckii]KAI7101552.1 hypothetical protein KC339_g6674 [Hortaea werneckii]KAI7240893.1 hypothetical protein KC365_g3668 [Hortaea werneckii]KAI7329560.1 hypothetical protein KC340_g4594 [Hortaea werneckii]KAI7407496.1 hypothetical protein KC328_g471 [Hortaea werneckii]
MPTIEHNTASPRRTLSKLRRNKGVANASTNSLASGSADGDDSSEGGLRVSMDAALEKVRGRARRKSADDRRGSEDTASRRLSGLISRKKPASKRDKQGLERNLSAPSGEDSLSISGNRSEGSLLDSGRSSQFTDDDSEHPGVNEQIVEGPLRDETSVVEPGSTASGQGYSQDTRETTSERPETPRNQPRRGRINTASLPATPDNLVETPSTLITPPTPTDPYSGASTFSESQTTVPKVASSHDRPLNSIESIRHRRAQSANLPSRLSNSIPAPLTPTIEESKTPGGTLTQPANASGFFSSFFSAAQKAADQLSNNINSGISGAQGKSKVAAGGQGADVIAESNQEKDGQDTDVADTGNKSPAVETLGKGELNLSHLGIGEGQDASPMTSTVDLPQQDQAAPNGSSTHRAEEEAAARAVSVAYEKPVHNAVSQATGRPMSVTSQDRLTLAGDQTPPRSTADGDGLRRSGSVRSRLSGRRRHRASSATTGTHHTTATNGAIAAAIQSSASTLAIPNTNAVGGGHRMTGFAVASSKRNKDFHALFRSVPEDDYLIEDYSAALQRDILLHGRLYVSEGHICFSSNILGWVTNLVISFDEVVSVEKRNTAIVFPNAIAIQTLHAKNTFASFVARDSTYELLIGIWKISHPNLKSSLNGVTVENAAQGDKTEVVDAADEDDGASAEGSEDEVYDEDDEDEVGSFSDATAPSIGGSDADGAPLSRKTSAVPVGALTQQNGIGGARVIEAVDMAAAPAPPGAVDFPGPATHVPTECTDAAEHYDRPITDATIPAPLGKVYSLMFGPASGNFMKKWLVEDQKSRELNYADDKFGLDNDHKSITFDYIKPLNGSIGPKQTKCITTNTLLAFDLERAVTIDCSTQTPDVPSGNVFTTKTRYCLMWAPGNATRLVATCTIEWTGKSWLKGPIEKGANDGQIDYVNSLIASLKAAVSSKPTAKGGPKKGKRKIKKGNANDDAVAAKESPVAEKKRTDWGMLEPLHQILEPLHALLGPFINSQVVIAVLFALLIYTWVIPPRPGTNVGMPGYSTPQKLAAYEELWRREESELWDWLEDRVGLDHMYAPDNAMREDRQKVLNVRGMGRRLEDESMNEHQMDEAVRITEERLSALKEAMARKRAKRQEA